MADIIQSRTVPGLLEHARNTHPERLAVTCGAERMTFADLHAAAWSVAADLTRRGVRPGDRVGICVRPSIDQPVAQLAVVCAGAVLVPMHPNLMAVNIAHVARDAGLRMLIVDDNRQAEIQQALPELLVVANGHWREASGPLPGSVDSPELAMLIYSSGSTGRPKGIMVTQENVVRGAEIVSGYLGTRAEDRIAGLLTLNFDYGLNQLWQTLLTGSSLHLHEFVMPRTAFNLLAEERITALPVMPALVQRLFATRAGGPPPGLDLSSVRYVCSSGGAVSDWALSVLKETFPQAEIVLMYGLSEAFRSSYLPPDQLARRPTSIGRAIPGVELHVLDENGADCAPGELGILVHRGGCISNGYWNNAEATARTFRTMDRFPGERVVWSGDLASRDEDGYFYIHGRADTQLKRDGFRISPNEVEAVLNEHPAVADSVVMGRPDGDRGHKLVAAWTPRPGRSEADGPDQAWLVSRLPAHMIPTELRYLPEFPTTANQGKADRQSLAKLFETDRLDPVG